MHPQTQLKFDVMAARKTAHWDRKVERRKKRVELSTNIFQGQNRLKVWEDMLEEAIKKLAVSDLPAKEFLEFTKQKKEIPEKIDQLKLAIKNWQKELADIDPEQLRLAHIAAVKAEQRRKYLAKHPPHGPGKKKH